MAETASESLTIKMVGTEPHLEGPATEEISVSTTLLQAIMSGAAPYAEYHVEQDTILVLNGGGGIKGPKRGTLTFELANVTLVYTQTGPPVHPGDDERVPGFAPFKLVAATWKADPHV